MASCDDDFSPLLGDDSNPNNTASAPTNPHHLSHAPAPHHLHQTYSTATVHRFSAGGPTPLQTILNAGSPDKVIAGEEQDDGEDYGEAAAFCSNPFENDSDQNGGSVVGSEKRKDHHHHHHRDEQLSDGGGSGAPYSYKKAKAASASGTSGGGGEYRKDREEWSDAAIACLLDAYTDKFTQLNRGNLRGRHWEEVAATVSERCERQTKSVEQCKNKVDNLKKRYKLERDRMNNGGISASHWPWFKKMEQIVGNNLPVKVASDDDKGASSSGNTPRQSKRYALTTGSSAGQIHNIKPKSTTNPRWRRVVFKISGASLAGAAPNNIDSKVVMLIAREVAMAARVGVQVAIVVGGRNFFCGDTWVNTTGLDRTTAYQIGMMATVMNSVLLQSAIEKMGVQTRVQTAFSMHEVAEPYSRQRAIRHLEKGRVVIFAGIGASTGNPLFSTDTAAAFRSLEIHAEAVLKGTNVDGVYDCTSQDNNFTFEHISFRELVARGATLMDSMALTYCEENRIPVVVFNLLEPGNISKALCGEQVGTLIDLNGRIS
ncbi:uridylate kinase PUMPKIN, chloroplastic [Humulus lupulus]|uniref:uridylate kinase PUMPKIN, chloroplastic n=1 Tax=Humulus lupulus TaxID=3486 RepID=UPI002B405DDE|nr:uridylate kinase PUMPKIN, chloroplastic [Humulus lupulus]